MAHLRPRTTKSASPSPLKRPDTPTDHAEPGQRSTIRRKILCLAFPLGGFSKKESADIVDLVFEMMKETLGRGEKIKISGFGNFVLRDKRQRPGRNPQTGDPIKISERRVLTFKASQILKQALNAKEKERNGAGAPHLSTPGTLAFPPRTRAGWSMRALRRAARRPRERSWAMHARRLRKKWARRRVADWRRGGNDSKVSSALTCASQLPEEGNCWRASCTWSRSWTGTRVASSRGGCRTRSIRVSASRRLKRLPFGPPETFNTDQGAQCTADAFTKVLRDCGIAISMDGKGRCLDNVFVERLWRSLKYEEVYLHAYDSGVAARAGIGRYLDLYNDERPHQALGYQTPAAFYPGLARNAA